MDDIFQRVKMYYDQGLWSKTRLGNMVIRNVITEDEYMKKLDDFVSRRTNIVKQLNNQWVLNRQFNKAAGNYKKDAPKTAQK